MKTNFQSFTKPAFVLWISYALSAAIAQPVSYDEKAKHISNATGIRGGLIVHIGCNDGKLTAVLRTGDSYLVHGLDRNIKNIKQAREYIKSRGCYGEVSVDYFEGRWLPYVDNLVNLVVAEDIGDVPMNEVMRVLAPNGAAYIKKDSKWTKTVKPWPKDIDEWTHFLHGPDNNAVARDHVVGPPFHLQWLSEPKHLRSHEHLNSLSALVSAQGRIFYIIDEGPTASVVASPRWRLVARDAFNGILLWKRDIGPWEGHFRLFRSGPPAIARRLVAVGDRVYATLGYGKQVAAFDASTGNTVRTYDETEGALEITHDSGRLFIVVGTIDKEEYSETSKRFYPSPAPRRKGIVALNADTGQVLWKLRDNDTSELMPTTLAVSNGRLFFQNTKEVMCLNAYSGKEKWRANRPVYTQRLSWSAPTLVVHDDVVLSADGSTGGLPPDVPRGDFKVEWVLSDKDIRKHPTGDLVAFSAETGKRLWAGRSLQGFCNPGDLFVINGLVWAGANVAPKQTELNFAVDLKTGQLKIQHLGDPLPVGGHTRCYRDKATERFLVLGGRGVEFVNLDDWSFSADPWVRGTCQYGVMPCNGLLYVPPDSCACMPNMRLHGFTVMSPKRASIEASQSSGTTASQLLQRGPAYISVQEPKKMLEKVYTSAWPTYRGDNSRSGWTNTTVPSALKPLWQSNVGGKLSSLTVSNNKVYVSRIDTHTIYALYVDSGEIAWSYTVGGRVDSPPTVWGGLVLFGCRDGWVYCLRAGDGMLVWRFRAAPGERFLVANGGIESVWPVHGSVLVRDGLVWFAAGRSSFLDGGMRFYALEIESGKCIVAKKLNARAPESTGMARHERTPATLPDILSASGDLMYMGWMGFDKEGRIIKNVKPHIFSATGFLDDTWWHRTYWQYGTWMRGGFGGWPQAARQVPAGRLLVINDDSILGFGRSKFDSGNPEGVHAGHIGLIKDTYQDMGRIDYSRNPYRLFCAVRPQAGKTNKGKQRRIEYKWQTLVPMLVRGMLLADQTLFIAGPHIGKNLSGLAELDTVKRGLLWAVSSADGKKLAEYSLVATPVLDGMAAANERIYVSMANGSISCLAGE